MRKGLLAIVLALLFSSAPALGDGAFPDELSVMLPQDPPGQILLGTNFGLVVSPDAGNTWRYVCEEYITGSHDDIVTFYQAGSAGTVLATSFSGLWRTGDGGCTWTRPGGSVSALVARDVFIDPVDPSFVLAIEADLNAKMDEIHTSIDGGRTFQGPVYATANRLTGVEIARSNPNRVYASELNDTTLGAEQTFLVTSADHGQTWNRESQPLPLPRGTVVRIAAVDPLDENTVYLRVFDVARNTDGIAITRDGGQTVSAPFTIPPPTSFSTFLAASDGTLLAGTTISDLYAATPGSARFVKRPGPRARCLGQRQGDPKAPIYACGDGFLDGYNLGISTDGAQSFAPRMNFTDIAGPLTCPAVSQACAAEFAELQERLATAPRPPPPGGGTNSAPRPGCASGGTDGALLPGLVIAALASLKLLCRSAATSVRGRQIHRP